MTITSAQQASASAVQIAQQVRGIKNMATQISGVLANGSPANAQQGLPGFSAADLATILGSPEVAALQAAFPVINAL